MGFPGQHTSGPNCCCCNDLWALSPAQNRRIRPVNLDTSNSQTLSELGFAAGSVPAGGTLGHCYNPATRELLYLIRPTGSPSRALVRALNEKTLTAETVLDKTVTYSSDIASAIGWVGCDPLTDTIFYGFYGDGTGSDIAPEVYKVQRDGTGDTLLEDWSLFTELGSPFQLSIPNSNMPGFYHGTPSGEVYFVVRYVMRTFTDLANGTSTHGAKIFAVPQAGGAHSELYGIEDVVPDLTTNVTTIEALDYDAFHEQVYFSQIRYTTPPATQRLVRKINDDGTGVTTLVTDPGYATSMRVSYKDACLYTWDREGAVATDTTGGLRKRDFDYVQTAKLMHRNAVNQNTGLRNVDAGPNIGLGCGYENLLSAYQQP